MKNKIRIVKLSSEQEAEFNMHSTKSGWCLIPKSEIPTIFPLKFREKIDSAVAITAPTSTGGTYMVYSANRIDKKDRAIDIEPFGLIAHSTGASAWGIFMHHGSWVGRTEKLPDDLWGEVERSGVGNYFLSSLPPSSKRQGSLEELPKGHREGFDAIIKAIRAHVDKK